MAYEIIDYIKKVDLRHILAEFIIIVCDVLLGLVRLLC